MGLDVYVYQNMVRVPDGQKPEWPYFRIGASNPEFSRPEPLVPGTYAAKEAMTFRAGSYSSHNVFRETLAAGVYGLPLAKTPHTGPFAEFLHFSDSEGLIGPALGAKLAEDFAAYSYAAGLEHENNSRFMSLYRHWWEAFVYAADGGVVVLA